MDDPDAPISSIYTYAGAHKTCVLRENFKGGKAIFVVPPFPIKCGGAPLKAMFLSEDTFRRNKIEAECHLYSAPPVFFPPCKKFSDALEPIAAAKGIKAHFKQVITEIDKDRRVAMFKNADG